MDKDSIIITLQQTIAAQTVLLEKLQAQIDQLLRVLYGKKSERQGKTPLPADKPSDNPLATSSLSQKNTPAKNLPKRQPLPEHLARIDVEHDLSLTEKTCTHCQMPQQRIGKRITEQVDFVPAQLIVRRHICYRYACRCGRGGVTQAALPAFPIEKGKPGAGLLADIIISKYQDALPLYRQSLRFKRFGFVCPESTMGDWLAECALLLEPIVKRMQDDLLTAHKLHTDDTPVPVLAKGKTKQGRLWVYLADNSTRFPCCIYHYTPTRSQQGPLTFLASYKGYLQADAYPGYDKLYTQGDIIEVGCFAHARRKFYDIAVAAKAPTHAHDIIVVIAKLYHIEHLAPSLTCHERYYYRKKYSKPILKSLRRKLNRHHQRAILNTPFYNAVQYALNQWVALTRFLSHGDLNLDNNKAERAIKPVVIGRKNWLFAGSDEGGKRAAIFYSLIETCKMQGINSFHYLSDVLARIPTTLHRDIHTLLPYHWQPKQ